VPTAKRLLETIGLTYRTVTLTFAPPGAPVRTVNWDRNSNTGSSAATNINYAYFGPGVASNSQYVPILGYSHLVARPGTTTGGVGTARPAHGPIVIERGVSAESLDEAAAAWSGRKVLTTNLAWFSAGTTALEQLRLTDSALSWSIGTRVDGTVSTKVEHSYNAISQTVGSQTATWNVAAGTP
jgi:hypothetical protein